MRTSPRPGAPQSVLGRAIAILEAFGAEESEVSLAQLSNRTGIAKATTHRIAAALTEARMLERSGGGYRLGVHLFELGERVPQQRDLRRVAVPYMEDLYQATQSVVHLAVLDGVDVLYFAKISGRRSANLPTRVGGRMPASATALGKCLLAHAPRDVIAQVIDAGLPRLTPYSIVLPRVFLAQLAEVRKQGYALEREEACIGNVCTAAPVLDGKGRPVAALSVSGVAGRMDPELLVPAVRATALSLGRDLARSAFAVSPVGSPRRRRTDPVPP